MNTDTVIIGAGASGMSCAIALAKAGREVVLVEKSRQPAPTLRGFQRHGCYFDTGFHYAGAMAPGELLGRFLAYLGISEKIELLELNQFAFDNIRIEAEGVEFGFPYGWDRLNEVFGRRFPNDCEAVERYFGDVHSVYENIREVILDPEEGLSNMLDPSQGMSLKEYLDQLTDNSELKALLSIHSLLYGMPPDETPFDYHARIMGTYYESVHGVKGGGTALADAFAGRLDELNISLLNGLEVRRIKTSDGRVSAVELEDGTEITCKQCVASCHPQLLLDLFDEADMPSIFRKRLERYEDTVSAHALYASCSNPPNWMRSSNMLVSAEMGQHTSESGVPLAKRPLFVTSVLHGDNGSGEYGFSVLFPASPDDMSRWADSAFNSRPSEYVQYKKDLASELLARLEAACPSLKGKVTVLDAATPLTLKHYTNSPHGSMYGIKHKVRHFTLLPQTRIDGLLLTGQAVITPGLFGVVLAGLVTAGKIIGYEHMKEELESWL